MLKHTLLMHTSLTHYEMQLVNDAQILIIKNKIMKMVSALLGDVAIAYSEVLQAKNVLKECTVPAKISRGENYLGLPYVILDYPRQFGKTDVFAVRSFFWWGNFFSITLHLSGQYQVQYASSIQKAVKQGYFDGWFIGTVAVDPWQHHFEEDNYTPITKESLYNIAAMPFLKLSKKIPLREWDCANTFFTENFIMLIKTLTS